MTSVTYRSRQRWKLFWCILRSTRNTIIRVSFAWVKAPASIAIYLVSLMKRLYQRKGRMIGVSHRVQRPTERNERLLCVGLSARLSLCTVFMAVCLFFHRSLICHSYALFLFSLLFVCFLQDTPRSRSHKRWVRLNVISVSSWDAFICREADLGDGLKMCLSESAKKEASGQRKDLKPAKGQAGLTRLIFRAIVRLPGALVLSVELVSTWRIQMDCLNEAERTVIGSEKYIVFKQRTNLTKKHPAWLLSRKHFVSKCDMRLTVCSSWDEIEGIC